MNATLPTKPYPMRHRHGVNHIAISNDRGAMATADVDMFVQISSEGRQPLQVSLASDQDKIRATQRIRGLAFSPDGEFLHVAAADRITTYVTATGDVAWHYMPPRFLGFLIVSPVSVAVSSTGLLAVGFDNGKVGIWTSSGELQGQFRDVDVQRQLAFTPNGERLIGCDSFGLSVFEVESRTRLARHRLRDRAYGMAIASDAEVIAVRTLQEVLVMEIERGDVLMRMPVGTGLPLVAIHPSRAFIACGESYAVQLMTFGGEAGPRFDLENAGVVSLAFSPDGGQLMVGCSDHQVRAFDLPQSPAEV